MTNPLPYPPHPGLNRCPQVLVVLLFFLSLLVTRGSAGRRTDIHNCVVITLRPRQVHSACPTPFPTTAYVATCKQQYRQHPSRKETVLFYNHTHTHTQTHGCTHTEEKVFRAVQVRVLSSIGYMHPNVGR